MTYGDQILPTGNCTFLFGWPLYLEVGCAFNIIIWPALYSMLQLEAIRVKILKTHIEVSLSLHKE